MMKCKLFTIIIIGTRQFFDQVERMDEYRKARRVLMAEVSGGRVRGRPRLGWMDGVGVALGNKGMTVQAARQCAKDRKEWRALVQSTERVFSPSVLSDRPSGLWWLSPETGGMPLHDAVGIN